MCNMLQLAERIVLWFAPASFVLSVDRKLKGLNIEAQGEGLQVFIMRYL